MAFLRYLLAPILKTMCLFLVARVGTDQRLHERHDMEKHGKLERCFHALIIRLDVTSSDVLVTIYGMILLHHCLARPLACISVHMTVSEPQALEGDRRTLPRSTTRVDDIGQGLLS